MSCTPAEATAGLIAACAEFPGAHVCESEQHPWLMKAAQEHADYQAKVEQQSHQLFMAPGFFDDACEATGVSYVAEIAAESWSDQTHADGPTLGLDAFKSWNASPGHWRVASTKHRFYGAGMALGADGIWYSTILTAD